MAESRCRGCGKRIVWAEVREDEKLKRIPLDPSAPTYMFMDEPEGGFWFRSSAMVSHFKTCPNANDFSRTKMENRRS